MRRWVNRSCTGGRSRSGRTAARPGFRPPFHNRPEIRLMRNDAERQVETLRALYSL